MKKNGMVFAFKPGCVLVTILASGTAPNVSAEVPFYASEKTSINLYGILDVARAYSSNQGGRSNVYTSQSNLIANKFGLLTTRKIGEDTQLLLRMEGGFNVITGKLTSPNYVFDRQAFVGVNDKRYGSLTLGRQYTPYFHHVAALGPTNVLTGATGAHPGDVDALDTTLRFDNSVTYTMPKMAGWQASGQYAFGSRSGPGTGDAMSAAVRYDHEAFSWSAGYVGLKNLQRSHAIGSFAKNSPVNSGYASADSARLFGTAARYTFGKPMVGLNYTNVRYAPSAASVFAQAATFNSYGIISTYDVTPKLRLAAGYSYTAELARNGIRTPARYHQFSLEQMYVLNKYVAFYAIESYQTASGQTLHTVNGQSIVVDAVASVGDSQNASPSGGPHQFVGMVGVRFSL